MTTNYIYWDGKTLDFRAKNKYNIIFYHEYGKLLISCSIFKDGYGSAIYSLSKDLELYYFLGIEKLFYVSEEVDKTLLYTDSRESVVRNLEIRCNMLDKEQKIKILEKVLVLHTLNSYRFPDGSMVSTSHGNTNYADSHNSGNYFFSERIFAFTGLINPLFVQKCGFDFTVLENRFKSKHGKHTDYEFLLEEYKKEIESIPIPALLVLAVPNVYSDIYNVD